MGRLRLEKRPLDTPGPNPLYFSYFAVLPLEKPWPPRRGFFVSDPSAVTPTALPAITRGLFYNPNEIEPMPEKDPTLWAALWVGLTTSPTWQGAIMASIIATLRILYDGKETRWTRILLESLICGCLSLAASSGIEWLGWPSTMAVALGGAIGFLGVTAIRDWLVKWTGKKAEQ